MREQTKLIKKGRRLHSLCGAHDVGSVNNFDTRFPSSGDKEMAPLHWAWRVGKSAHVHNRRSMYSVFATIIGAIYGIPILWYLSVKV